MKEITVEELKQWMQECKQFQLIDIREEKELVEDGKIESAERIRMHDILDNVEKLKKNIPVILFCRTGERSSSSCQQLVFEDKDLDLYNLTGGIKAWNDLHRLATPSLLKRQKQ